MRLAPGKAGGHLPGDRDEDLRVLLAVPGQALGEPVRIPGAARSAMVPDRRHSGPGRKLAWRQASRQYKSSARTLQRITRDRTRMLSYLSL